MQSVITCYFIYFKINKNNNEKNCQEYYNEANIYNTHIKQWYMYTMIVLLNFLFLINSIIQFCIRKIVLRIFVLSAFFYILSIFFLSWGFVSKKLRNDPSERWKNVSLQLVILSILKNGEFYADFKNPKLHK